MKYINCFKFFRLYFLFIFFLTGCSTSNTTISPQKPHVSPENGLIILKFSSDDKYLQYWGEIFIKKKDSVDGKSYSIKGLKKSRTRSAI